jgi:sugar phosphate isomerase/epimerase
MRRRLGISTTVDISVDIETQLELFGRAGFDFVSLCARPDHSHFFQPAEFQKILGLAREQGMFIESTHAPFEPPWDPAARSPDDRRKAIDGISGFMQWAVRYEIPIVIVHPHYYFEDRPEDCLERAARSLEEIVSGKPKNLTVAIENMPTSPGSWICEQLLGLFDNAKLGFCYDSSHENMSGRPFHLLEKFYERLTTTHLSDNHAQADDHLPPGDGVIDWQRLKSYIDKAHQLNNILFEVGTGEPLSEPIEGFVMRTARRAREIFL